MIQTIDDFELFTLLGNASVKSLSAARRLASLSASATDKGSSRITLSEREPVIDLKAMALRNPNCVFEKNPFAF
jgi:hypothetical protein